MSILQNLWMQIALGVVPALLFAIILLIAKKVKAMAYITLTASLCILCVCGCVFGVLDISSVEEDVAEEEDDETPVDVKMSQEDLQDLAYAFLRVGDIENAERMVNIYSKQFGYDSDCALITARIAVIDQNYDRALGIYKKLYGSALPDEATAVEMIVGYNRSDNVLFEELNAAGLANGEKYDVQQMEQLVSGGAADLVFQAIDKENLGAERQDAAQWISDSDDLFAQYVETGFYDESRLNTLLSDSKKHASDAAFEQTEIFRETRVKLLLAAGKFSDIAANLDEYSGNSEYLTALELYLNGKLGRSELEKALGIEEIKGSKTLLTQLKQIRNNSKDLSEEDIKKLDEQIASLESDSNKVLYKYESLLNEMVDKDENRESASKMYMSLANISSKLGDSEKRNQYISDALLTAPDSDDDEYSSAMNNLANVISGNGDSNDIKNIGDDSAAAVDNSYYIPGAGKIIRNETVALQQAENVQDYALKARAAVTINSVDASNFEEIVIKVQVSDEFINEQQLKSILKLKDCNYEITDFTIEKVQYQKANIILVCDNSGSMSGSIGSLQNAVNKFLETSNEQETIGFYTFDNDIIQSLPLGTATDEQLKQAVEDMYAQGGTSIFGSLEYILNSTTYDSEANQAIILMTDGQDGYGYSDDYVYETISNLSTQKGYMVYVLGMGDSVNVDYLSGIADASGGQFIFAPTDAQLESLYNFIHGTLKNQYKITFTAKDTITANGREVVVSLDQQEMGDSAIYNLSAADTENTTLEFDRGVSVSGLSERLIYKEKENVDVFVNGTGFSASDYMTITLVGERTYSLSAEYVSETQFKVNLPAEIAIGEYDAEVNLGGRKAIFLDELNVVEGEPDEIRYGGYTFKAFKIKQTDYGVTLSSNVVMNGWLNFNGEITLEGDLNDASLYLEDYSGSYVEYSASSAGYAKQLASEGKVLNIPALGSLKLYNAAQYSGEYPTEPQDISHLRLPGVATFQYPSVRLYPDRIALDIDNGITDLPLQDYFISVMSGSYSPFSFEYNMGGTITGYNISIDGDISLGYLEDEDYVSAVAVDILDMRGSLQKDAIKFKFDTLTNESYLGLNVKLPNYDEWFGFAAWYKDGKLDGFEIAADVGFDTVFAGVPVTYSDFKLSIDNVTSFMEVKNATDANKLALSLSLKAEAAPVSKTFPGLKKYVGDLSLVSVDAKGTVSCGTSMFSEGLSATAKLKLLNLIDVMDAEFKMGEFTYTNALLGIDDQNVFGLMVGVGVGLNMDIQNLKINLRGSEVEVVLTDRFIGIDTSCSADLELNWWGPDFKYHTDGQNLMGFFKDDAGNAQFTVRSSEVKDGKRVGLLFYIEFDGDKFCDGNYQY